VAFRSLFLERDDGGARVRAAALAPALAVLVLVFAAPLAWFLVISFWTVRARIMRPAFTGANYVEAFRDYWDVLLNTLVISGLIATLTTVLAFLFAYAIRFKLGRLGPLFLMLTLITLFGGYLVKVYAWKSILGTDGVLNKALLGSGVISEPLAFLLYSANGVVVTLTYFLLPFAILPIYGSLRGVRDVTLDAARDIGAGPFAVMRDIVLPQCKGGLLAAFTLSFLVSVGDYVTPKYVGGGTAMMGTFIENQYSIGFNWPLGSAMAFVTMGATLLVVLAVRQLLEWALRP
jgi:spermidine/putrescine transport system permease protein